MLTTIIALALLTEAPQPDPRPATAPHAQVQRKTTGTGDRLLRRYRPQPCPPWCEVSAGMARERSQAEAAYLAQVKAEAEYKAALPFLLENQRQQLDRMSALERSAALHRMASASEQIARAIELDAVARQNARMGYPTPALNTYGPGVSSYGPYGGVIIQPQQPQFANPYGGVLGSFLN